MIRTQELSMAQTQFKSGEIVFTHFGNKGTIMSEPYEHGHGSDRDWGYLVQFAKTTCFTPVYQLLSPAQFQEEQRAKAKWHRQRAAELIAFDACDVVDYDMP
jgi:hypothetical protein